MLEDLPWRGAFFVAVVLWIGFLWFVSQLGVQRHPYRSFDIALSNNALDVLLPGTDPSDANIIGTVYANPVSRYEPSDMLPVVYVRGVRFYVSGGPDLTPALAAQAEQLARDQLVSTGTFAASNPGNPLQRDFVPRELATALTIHTLALFLITVVLAILIPYLPTSPRKARANSRLKRSLCPSCGYPLKDLPSTTCPECGHGSDSA